MYLLISKTKDFKEVNETERNKIISDVFDKLQLSINKAEKDIGIYKNSISKWNKRKNY